MKVNLLTVTLFSILLFACDRKSAAEKSALKDKVDAQVEDMVRKNKEKELAKLEKWTYENYQDPMTDEVIRTAQVVSKEMIELDLPYEGGTYLNLVVRKSNQGYVSFIQSSNGQLITETGNETVLLRFDGGESIRFDVIDSQDYDSTVKFFKDANKIVELIKNSKILKIQVLYYDHGNEVFTFDVSNLNI